MVFITNEDNMDTLLLEINIEDYILEKATPAKVAASTIQIKYLDDASQAPPTDYKHAQLQCPQLVYPFARSDAVATEVPITAAKQLVAADDSIGVKRVLEITLDTETAEEHYQPGDTIAILPRNSPALVQALLAACGLEQKAQSPFEIKLAPDCTKKAAKLPPHIPTICTPYDLLRDCLNLNAVLKKQFLSTLAHSCDNATERAFLSGLSAKEGTTNYNTLILERGLTLFDLLQLCPSCQPTLEMLIEHLPRLLPRAYSIANSPGAQGNNKISIIFSILTTKSGVTTNMLAQLAAPLLDKIATTEISSIPPKIAMYFRVSNNFRFTADVAKDNNHILIGVGTALAPFLGFLEYKQQLQSNGSSTQTWMFAGAPTELCILQRERLLKWQNEGILQHYYEACSRVPNAQYRYVQDQLQTQAQSFVDFLMEEKTILFVCADGGEISKSIEKGVGECLTRTLQLSAEEVQQMLKELRAHGKYREDVWI